MRLLAILLASSPASLLAQVTVGVDPWGWEFNEIDISSMRGTNYNSYAMTVYTNRQNEEALYVGCNNENGCELWRSTDGRSFERLADKGLLEWGGNRHHTVITSFVEYKRDLYAGTWATGDDRCKIFRSTDGFRFELFMTNGFARHGAPSPNGNRAATYMIVHNGKLYVGVYNPKYGPQLWRYDGTSWRMLVSKGNFGREAGTNNTDVTTLVVYKGQLHLSTENIGSGSQVWRMSAASDFIFDRLNVSGFGFGLFTANSGLFVSGDELVANTWDFFLGCRVHRHRAGKTWVSEVPAGFGDRNSIVTTLYQFRETKPTIAMVGAYNPVSGFDLWSRFPGGEWVRVARPSDLGLSRSYTFVGATINWKRDMYMAVGSYFHHDPAARLRLYRASARPRVEISYTANRLLRVSIGHPKGWAQALKLDRISLAADTPASGWTGNLFYHLLPTFRLPVPSTPTKITLELPGITVPPTWRIRVRVTSYDGLSAEAEK
ncbi:MAG: hypothetical protein ACE5F1_10630 [Planctomycetota bacterium]